MQNFLNRSIQSEVFSIECTEGVVNYPAVKDLILSNFKMYHVTELDGSAVYIVYTSEGLMCAPKYTQRMV